MCGEVFYEGVYFCFVNVNVGDVIIVVGGLKELVYF